MAKTTRANPRNLSTPFANYSHVVTAEGAQKLVFCAGQVAADAAGAKLSDVTKVTIYICNPHDVPKARGILPSWFDGHPPASTLSILRVLANPTFPFH